MLWLCLYFPRLAVELRQPPDEGPVAVIERQGQRRCVLAVNDRAGRCGIQSRMDATVAQARAPELKLIERSAVQERRALKALAAWGYRWSGDVCVEPDRGFIALEVGSSLRLFGGLEALQEQVIAGVETLGYSVRTGVAPTFEGAALLASSRWIAPPGGQAVVVTTLVRLRQTIGRHPLTDLALPQSITGPLQEIGIARIGDLLKFPAADVARRFGPQVIDYLQRLTGEKPDPRKRFRMADRYRRELECAYPIDTAMALLFPMHRMLQELQGYLRGRDKAVDGLSVTFRHRDRPPTVFDLHLSAPQRDALVLTPLLRERLERTVLAAPATHIVLEARRLVEPVIGQSTLFEERTAHDAQWSQLLDRLRARLGEAAIHALHLADDHRPERAWCEVATGFCEDEMDRLPERPVWILNPTPLRERPKRLGLPERIEAGWWSGTDCRRDYYVAETDDGARLWVFRDLQSGDWFVHGIWA